MRTQPGLFTQVLTPSRAGSIYYLVGLLCYGSYGSYIFVYLTQLNLTGEQVGLLSSLNPVMTILLATTISSIADRRHQRALFTQICLTGTMICFFLLRFPKSFSGVAVLMLLMAVCSAPTMALADSLVARMAQRHNLNFGGMRLYGSLGFAIGALVFGAVWQNLGYSAMFLISALMFLPQIFMAGKLEEVPVLPQAERQPFRVLFRDTGLVLLLAASFLSGISNSLAMTFSGILVNSLGAGSFLIGIMLAVGAISELPAMHFNIKVAERLGKVNAIILSYGLMAAAYTGFTLVRDPNLLPFFSILKGLGYGLWFTVTVRLLVGRTPFEWAATAQSLLVVTMFGISPLVAGPLGGLIHDVVSPGAVFGLGVVSLALAAGVLLVAQLAGKLK